MPIRTMNYCKMSYDDNQFKKVICLFLLFLVCYHILAFQTEESTPNFECLLSQRISNVLNYTNNQRPFKPTTLRIITFTPSDESLLQNLWVQAEYPIINLRKNYSLMIKPITRKNHTVTRRNLFTFITLVVIRNSSFFEKLAQEIKTTVDPRRDSIIFITSGSELISKLKNFQGLRKKILLDIDSDGFWVEPIVNNGDMIKINRIEQTPVANPMGQNLRGRHLRAAAPETPPFNYKAGMDLNGKPIIDGSLCRIFVEASRKFNFTYFINYEGFDYGTLHPNGTWTGAYSKVHYPNSTYDMDLIVSPELLWNRLDVAPIATYIDMIFGVSHPKTTKHWYAFLLPFDPEIWIITCIMFFGIGAVQGIVMYLMQGRQLKPVVIDSTSFLPFAITMEQGLQDIPVGMRYFTLILLMGCTVLGTGYKSTLRTHLMFPKPDPIPTTFDELADRTDYSASLTVYGALEKHFWATSEVRSVKKLRERLTFEYNWEECYKKVFLSQKKACISWMHAKYVVAKTMTLNTTVSPIVYSKDAAIRKFLSLGFQENSIYVDSFSRITGTFNAMGLVSKWEENIMTEFQAIGREKMLKDTKSKIFKELLALATPQEDAVPLELESLLVVFSFVPLGGLLGLLAFVCELYRFSKKNPLILIKEEKPEVITINISNEPNEPICSSSSANK